MRQDQTKKGLCVTRTLLFARTLLLSFSKYSWMGGSTYLILDPSGEQRTFVCFGISNYLDQLTLRRLFIFFIPGTPLPSYSGHQSSASFIP